MSRENKDEILENNDRITAFLSGCVPAGLQNIGVIQQRKKDRHSR